jgi:hypothetical protein
LPKAYISRLWLLQIAPWEEVAVDLIGPWKVKVNGQRVEFNALTLLKSLGIPTPRNPHYQALVISLLWQTPPPSYPVTKYLASQEYNRDKSLATTIQE